MWTLDSGVLGTEVWSMIDNNDLVLRRSVSPLVDLRGARPPNDIFDFGGMIGW